MNDKEKAELQAAVREYALGQTEAASLPPLQRPKELSDPNTPAPLRAQVLAAYTGALLDRPASTYTAEDRVLLGQQIRTVLKGLGF